jgi:CDGSH-type Zn-finger protein
MQIIAFKTVALYVCGGPRTESFCEGAHSKIGFRPARRVIRQEEGKV